MARDRLVFADGRQLPGLTELTCQRALDGEALPGALGETTLRAVVVADTDPVNPGELLDYYRGDVLLGRFYCQTPECLGPGQFSITAADAMILFDRELDPWLEAYPWPTTLRGLLEGLCGHCGVALEENPDLPGGDLPVEGIPGTGITGRQLLRWIGQAAGRYFCITPQGRLRAAWYTGETTALGGDVALVQLADGILAERWQRIFALRTAVPYQLGRLRYSNYETAPVARVLIRERATDVGTCWPADAAAEVNTLILQGNPLLAARQGLQLQQVARRLQEQLAGHSHRPFVCALVPGYRIDLGSRVSFTDAGGTRRTGLVTKMQLKNGCCTVTGTGSPALTGIAAYNRLRLEDVMGRVLTLEADAQGLAVRHTDLSGDLGELALRFDGITTRISDLETDSQGHATVTQFSQLEQRADSMELVFTQLQEDLEGKAEGEELAEITQRFRFDEAGLTISNSATGMGIGISQERVVFTGGEDPSTRITPTAMETTDLAVENRLDIGNFSLLPRSNGNLSLRWTKKK